MSRARALALPLITASLLIAACGSDDTTTGTDANTSATTTEVTVPETTSETTSDSTDDSTDDSMDETDEMDDEMVETTMAPETTDAAPETTAAALGTLVDVASAAGNFTTLLAAVEAAGLTDTLATGKFTVLAPTDEAFAALGQPAIDALLADPAQLTAVLQNHLLPLPQDAATLTIFNNVVTVAGTSLPVTSDGATITIGGATVVQADIAADNGIIHAIDTVLLPAPGA
jgi:uncharacterized surface protein with fasciclin (FAS1) repeats